ncbi:MAG: UvrD-helicase domain-containing protein [Halomonas sp.]|nr:UvrD-helicase domain-containing protein [Halomonas sp.]
MSEITVALSQEFLESFARIPRSKQSKVTALVTKFRQNPRSPGINYETLQAVRDPNMRSIRVDKEYRAIVLKPDRGNVYVLMWVDKHDDAYAWAARHRVDIHPETGSLQILASSTEETEAPPVTDGQIAPDSPKPAEPMFTLRDRELLRLGVPEAMIAPVKRITSEMALDAMATRLPTEAYEALALLAQGLPLNEVLETYAVPDAPKEIDCEDFDSALRRPDSQRRFHVLEDDWELRSMLEAPLAHWRVFLHPSQRSLVERDWNGPVRVLGGAGTGKTVVAMHRARWLAHRLAKCPDAQNKQRVLVTTFTRNLAIDIEHHLKQFCQPEELARIEVINIDRLVSRLTQARGTPRLVYDGHKGYRDAWQLALQVRPAEPALPESFYWEEWKQVILPQHVHTRQDYFKATRSGRGVALNRRQRAAIWAVFEEMRSQLSHAHLRPYEDCVFEAIAMAERGELNTRFAHIIIDEAQDFGAETLTLLRHLVPEGQNDLLIVGDGHQRIYGRRASLSRCGINIRGRGRKLRINYRTTEQTRRFAVALLEGQPIDDLDEGIDGQAGYRSLLQGQIPEVKQYANFDTEMDALAEHLKETPTAERLDTAGTDCCVTARTQHWLERIETALESRGIATRRVSRDAADDLRQPGVRLATMHRVKGLEFKRVYIVCVNDGVVPAPAASRTEDPVEKRNRELNERALLHVAATRSIERLYVSSHGAASSFLIS